MCHTGGSLSSVCNVGTSHGVCSMARWNAVCPLSIRSRLLSLFFNSMFNIFENFIQVYDHTLTTTTGLPPPVFPSASPTPRYAYIYIYMTNLCCPCLLGVELSTGAREIYQGPDPHKRTIPTLSSNPLPIAPHLRGRAWRSFTVPRSWLPSSCIGLAQVSTIIVEFIIT